MKKTLNIGGLAPLTTIDYPGCLAAVIFCQGCPYRCVYCHNQHLIANTKNSAYPWDEIYEFLQSRKNLLDAVVFSGGEPTLQACLYDAMQTVKKMGFKIGLHTAGSYPQRLEAILPLIDWVGLDIKADFNNYQMITKLPNSGIKPAQSLKLLLKNKVNFECRTTFHSSLFSESDILRLAQKLKKLGVKKYCLQAYRDQGSQNIKLKPDHPNLIQKITDKVNAIF